MKPISDFVIYLSGFVSTVFLVICGIYFSSNRTLGIWTLFGGIVFGLLTGFLYWQNDISKTQASKALTKEAQKNDSQNRVYNQNLSSAENLEASSTDKRPSVAVIIERLDSGALEWPNDPAKYSYLLLEMEVFNLEDHAIPLSAEPFELSAIIEERRLSFKRATIPLSGTVLYKDNDDKAGANIDHMDLQKFRELNTSRLYGHFDPSVSKQSKYLQSKHYILFLTTEVNPKVIHEMLIASLQNDSLPLHLTWRDVRNDKYDCHLTIKKARVTSGCYKVYTNRVKFYKP